MSDDDTATEPRKEILTASECRAEIKARAKALGGVTAAAAKWDVSPQMVHMVIGGKRKPTRAMLKDLELREAPGPITYKRKKPSGDGADAPAA